MALLKSQPCVRPVLFAAVLFLAVVLPANAQDDGATKKADDKKPVAKKSVATKPATKQEAKTPTSTPATRAAGSEQLRQLEALKRMAAEARASDSKAGAKPEAKKPAPDPKKPVGQVAGTYPTSQPAVKSVKPGERKKRAADEAKRRMDAAAQAAGERQFKGIANPDAGKITTERTAQDRESRRAERLRKAAEARKKRERRRLEREKQTEMEEGAPVDMSADGKPTPRDSERQPVVKKPAPPADGRTEWFNFDGMPWEDVIMHFAKRLGKPLMDIEDIDIGGHLTYINSRKFTKQEAIDELNLLLHRKGWRFIDTEFHIFAVPLNEMPEYVKIERTYKTRAEFEKENLRDMEYAAVYMKIEDQQAQDVVDTFGDAIPDYGRMSVVGKSNKIKILALAKDLRKLFSLYDMIDLEVDDGRQIKIFTIKTNVRDIERMLRDIEGVGSRTTVRRTSGRNRTSTRTPSAGADMSSVRMTADERTNTLVVKGTQSQIERIGKFIVEIDQLPELGKFYTEVIEIKHAKAVEIANAMTQIFQQEQGRSPSWQRLQNIRSRSNSSRSSRTSRTPTRSSNSAQATPADLMGESAFERAKKTILVSPYERTNSIIVYANLEGHERVAEMLEDLDLQLPSNFRTFKLEHARADQIFNTVNQLVQGLRRESSTGTSRFRNTSRAATVTPDPVQNALHVLAQPSEMEKIEEIIKQLDVEVSDENRHVVELVNLTPSRMAQIIQPMLAGGGSSGRTAFNPRRSGRSSTVRVAPTSQIIPIDEANLLVVICDEKTWTRVDKMIKAADENALTATPEIRHYDVLKANPNVLVTSLNTFYRNYQHPTLGRSSVVFTVSGKKITAQGVKPALDEIASLIETMDQEDAQQLEILDLIHADAAQLAQQMQPLFMGGRGGIRGRASGTSSLSIQADAVTNSLIVQADGATLEKIKNFAMSMDEKVGAQKPERKFYTLKHSQPREVSQAITTMFSGGSAGRGRFGSRTPSGAQVKAVVSGQQIIVEAPAEKHAEIAELIAQLDDPSGLEIIIKTIKMAGSDVSAIASRLTTAFREKVRKEGIVARFDADPASETVLLTCSKSVEEEADKLLMEYAEASKEIANKVEFRKLEHATATEAANWLRDQLIAAAQIQLGRNASRQVKVTADTRTNRIIINAPSVVVEMGMALLEQYDVPAGDILKTSPVEVRKFKLAGLEVDKLARTLTIAYRNFPARPDKLKIVFTSDALTENLVVSAPTDEFERIEALIKDFGEDTADLEQLQKFIKIVEADANYVAKQVRTSLTAQITRQRGRNVASRVSIQVDTRTNRLNVDAPKFAMAMAEALIAELDQPATSQQLQTIPLLNADASAVYNILRSIFSEKIRNRILTVSVEPMSNSLIVGGSQKDFDEIKSWAEDIDAKADDHARIQKIIELKNASPWEVNTILNQTFVQRRRVPAGKQVNITVIAGRSLVVMAPPEVMRDIESMIEKLDAVNANKMTIKTYKMPGLGTQLPAFARQIQNAVNGQMQAREQRISVTALPAADALIVTATETQFADVESAMKQFEGLYEPPKIATIELVAGDANAVYQALNRVLQPKIRAGKMTLSVETMTNSLIVSAPDEEMAEIREWVKKFDEAAKLNIIAPKLFKLKNASPYEVRSILTSTFAPPRSGRRGGVEIRFDILGGQTIVAKAPAEKMERIAALIEELDKDGGNNAKVKTFVVKGMGTKLTQFARDIQDAVNAQAQARERRITVRANPAADLLIVSAMEDQFALIDEVMEQFGKHYKPQRIESIALKEADANAVYQALNKVLTQ
ncbi:MAG: hypothetical protein IID33_02880, partial [Planctomycetes bacterium]|nr:hypothetical protein [Planctomycetota bacterium]